MSASLIAQSAGIDILLSQRGTEIEWSNKTFLALVNKPETAQAFDPLAPSNSKNTVDFELRASADDEAFSDGIPRYGHTIKHKGASYIIKRCYQPFGEPWIVIVSTQN